jgi:hypothetical protein
MENHTLASYLIPVQESATPTRIAPPASSEAIASPAAPRKHEWAPRIWEGSDFFGWMRLLIRNRFAVHPPYWYIAAIITFVSFCNTLGRLLQDAVFGKRVRDTGLRQPPLFIIGHWRTGTTLLHEMLIVDERHTYPTTYECLGPNHFLLTEELFSRWLWFLIPSRRPMDNMKAGWSRPQEDVFAMCNLGQPSPYLTIAFPNHPPQYQEFFDLEQVSPAALRRWRRTFKNLLKQLTFRNQKRLILKSPPHTCRLKILQRLFPGALFVHLVRDPYVVFPSTVNLWQTLYRTHGLQTPTFEGLEEYVFSTFTHMYERLEETRHLLEPSRFFEVRYEDLIKDPVGRMRALYEHLQLGDFDSYLPRLEKYLASVKGYETNRYQLTPKQHAEISRRWGKVIERYGYGTRAKSEVV